MSSAGGAGSTPRNTNCESVLDDEEDIGCLEEMGIALVVLDVRM
jgi:hypothetical protein